MFIHVMSTKENKTPDFTFSYFLKQHAASVILCLSLGLGQLSKFTCSLSVTKKQF